MAQQDVAGSIKRVRRALAHTPRLGQSADSMATACWEGGLAVSTAHPSGARVATDMVRELGGSGEGVTPGWLFRAGIAACATTSIVMLAASEGIELTRLELDAVTHSDARGLLGVAEDDGREVPAGFSAIALHVRIAAREVDAESLRALVDEGLRRSPVNDTIAGLGNVELRVDVQES